MSNITARTTVYNNINYHSFRICIEILNNLRPQSTVRIHLEKYLTK